MLNLTRPALVAAGLGGALWTAKALIITARDGSFDPLESVFFLGGMFALIAAAVLVAHALTRSLRGGRRAGAAVVVAIGLVAATTLLTSVAQAGVGAIAPGDNLGLEEEGGILAAGLVWLTIAAAGARRTGYAAVSRVGLSASS